jgi:copper chaperone CopZ
MNKVTFDVPSLWADHHVLKAHAALTNLDGVESVHVSAAWKQVLVSFDPNKTDEATIQKALAEAGFPVGEGGVPVLALPTENRKDPAWTDADFRMTKTNRADLEMSGEFRRY